MGAKVSIVSEFREFIARGNVIDLAVGVIIGAAFNSIVKSLVDQVIMPPIGLLMGGIDFSHFEWVLKADDPATAAIEKVAIQYGAFLNACLQFVIVAWAVFMLVKLVNVMRRQQEEQPKPADAAPTPTESLLMEIRDAVRGTPAAKPAAAKPAPKAAAKPTRKAPAKKR